MTSKSKPAMNPTVEDETNSHGANPMPIHWSEIFSRHEAVLCSHFELLNMVKGQITPEPDALRAVSSMVNKTIQAMNQLKVVRKHMMNSKSHERTITEDGAYLSPHLRRVPKNTDIDMTASENTTTSSASTPSNPSNPPHSTDSETNTRKKRRRVSREKEPTRPDPEVEVRSSKRSRDTSFQSQTQEDDYTTSTSLGTEDISAEPDKRKRESLASNEDASPAAKRPRAKRLKMDRVRKREADMELENGAVSPNSKRRKSPPKSM
ncbi:hypothetical protein N7535_008653 [Penicillium sp. DV-2018c]|nr:hypothetical protein N7461_002414 [Penicillium sp. DV-2018c]KAJ5563489.1 hypothetical protein N7535_008653 [Penicillium sp. DV-2018c]